MEVMIAGYPRAAPAARPAGQTLLEALLAGEGRRLVLLTGPPMVLDLGTALAARVLFQGRRVLYVDGANAFDPYILSRMAKGAGVDPRSILQRLLISRAFTCHQLETLIAERLGNAIRVYRPSLTVISGWSSLFHDENVPFREALRLLQNTAARVAELMARGAPFLATHLEEPRTARLATLRATLVRVADTVARIEDREGLATITGEKPRALSTLPGLVVPQEAWLSLIQGSRPRMHPWR